MVSEDDKKKRRRRYERDMPPPMRFTERDAEIVRLVHSCRLLTREQIEKMLFRRPGKAVNPGRMVAARRRLRFLFHNGYLDRIRVPLAFGSFASQPVYKLGKKGKEFLTVQDGVVFTKREKEIGELFINHALAVNGFRIAVSLAAKKDGYQVLQWITDSAYKSGMMRDTVMVRKGGHKEEVSIIPDSYFVLSTPKGKAHFFLELDRGRLENTLWKVKVLAYKEYWDTGKYQKRYQTTSLRILTVTTTPTRLAHMKAATEEAKGDNMFWFTTIPAATPEQVLDAPIWTVVGLASPQALIA